MAYKHPSWNWEQWENLWPTRHAAHPVFNTSACSTEFKRLHQSDMDVLEAMQGDNPVRQVSLASVRQLSERLERWMQSPVVEEQLTLPPSVAGFHRALAHEIENNPSLNLADGCFVVALIDRRPGDVAHALKMVPEDKLNADWKVLLEQVTLDDKKTFRHNTVSKNAVHTNIAPTKEPSLEDQQHDTSESELKPVRTPLGVTPPTFTPPPRQRFDFSEAQKSHGALFLEWVKTVKSESDTISVQRQNFDGLVKRNVFQYQGASSENFNRWLEDFAVGALATLSQEDMSEIMELWPTHQHMTFSNPVKTLGESSFWQNTRRMTTATRKYFLETVLPTIVSSQDWNNDIKYDLLPKMLEKTDKHEFMAEERLKLWLALGGDLDAVISKRTEDVPSAFEMVETHSVRQWIEEQNQPVWQTVLDKVVPSRKSGMTI